MAERNFDFLETIGRKKRVLAGSFAPDTANPPTAIRGSGYSVVRTAQGVFTLTFANSYAELTAAVASVQLATGAAREAQIGTYTPATSSAAATLVIRVLDNAAAAQDIAADANNRVHFVLVFNDALTV